MNDLIVIGLGYVGLPLVREATRAGMQVTGYDYSRDVTEGLNAGRSHVDDISDADVKEMGLRGFRATSDPAALGTAQVAVICVPTPLSPEGGPDLTAVRGATRTVATMLRPGMLVVLESTSYPGTTDEVVRPILEEATDLTAGADFSLAFSPERIDPGNREYELRTTPKIVGGHTPDCTRTAVQFYSRIVDQVVVAKGMREAEMAKLLENTYRHVNIALVNEMAVFCHEMDIDLWDVIRCASTKPFGFHAFHPGPGVGGHCIPIDPNYLADRVSQECGHPFRFVELAQEIDRLAAVTRTGKAAREDLSGSTFTITSLGALGGVLAAPIINYPEVAILGVHKISRRPAVVDEKIVIRDLMNLSISVDHRVVDGYDAARFIAEIKAMLESPNVLGVA